METLIFLSDYTDAHGFPFKSSLGELFYDFEKALEQKDKEQKELLCSLLKESPLDLPHKIRDILNKTPLGKNTKEIIS